MDDKMFEAFTNLQEAVLGDMKQMGEVLQIIKVIQERVRLLEAKMGMLVAHIQYPISKN